MRKSSRVIAFLAILLFSFYLPLLSNQNSKFEKGSSLKPENPPFIPPKFNEKSISSWKEIVQSADHNNNGINDQFEQKLYSISDFITLDVEDPYGKKVLTTQEVVEGLFGLQKKPVENLSPEHIPVIIHFPDGCYDSVLNLFEELDGNIKSTYKFAINGFAGVINHEGLKRFCDILTHNDVPFMIEEDSVIEANLYYASRNMNLRPYVWNNLSYSGDNQGSLAVFDTGIDDSHNFFTPGFSSGNFSYKIVGWQDELNGLSSPYDDNGHGSHCSGIIAGDGSPVIDGNGRTVSTYDLGLNYTGYYVLAQSIDIIAAKFNVTDPGIVEVQCEFEDFTHSSDNISIYAFLYQGDTIVDSYLNTFRFWNQTLSYTAIATTLGEYSLRIRWIFDDKSGDGYVANPHMRFRGELHWPFDPPLFGSGDAWKGVAPDTHLVGVKVLASDGRGVLSDILDGINWVITNKTTYHITTISMSLGGTPGQTSLINAVNNAVNNGIVTVVSAGNAGSGGSGSNIGSPGDADNVITVAAMSNADQVTDYSSSGGSSFTGTTSKPDIMAPGGSYYNFSIFSADTNDNDADGEYPIDGTLNDLYPNLGTSMSTPAVAGAANLLIEAMGGYPNWNYSANEAKRVKALILMTATETYPLTREVDVSYSPQLNRGGKDIHEGYGRLNIDAALEATSQELNNHSTQSARLTSSLINPFEKHALGCYVDLIGGNEYYFTLEVPDGADFDLHLYSNQPSACGDPIMIASGTSPGLGVDETFSYTPPSSGRYYLITKAISGEGLAKLHCKTNKFAANLSGGSINPPAGNSSTPFNFTVIYTDQDDNLPTFINVLINGTPYPIEKFNLSDIDFTDGCLFQTMLYLQPGTYNYQFECSDGKYYNSTSIFPGVTVTGDNLFQPSLSSGNVIPGSGSDQYTLFTFSVNYTDQDNNKPNSIDITINSTTYTMIKQDALDTNYMDGCIYLYSTTLDAGSYVYHFNCSDGVFQSSLGLFLGPNVTETIKVAILESPGTDPAYIALWDELNVNWDKYGMKRLIIDYISLAKSDITYRDLVESQADVIVLPNAWGSAYDYTPAEVNAIKQYVQAGKGIVASSSTFYAAPNNRQLAPIFGMNLYMGTSMPTKFNQLDIDPLSTGIGSSPLFHNLSSPMESYSGYTLSGWKLNQSDPGVLAAAYVGAPVGNISNVFTGAAVIFHEGGMTGLGRAIYCTHLDLYNYGGLWTSTETQLYYNVISYSSGITLSNNAPVLSSGSVAPTTGDQMTQYNFSVVYTDSDNNLPIYVDVLINGTSYPMAKQNPLDLDYTDGCVYQYLTYLQPGTYNYQFECADWKESNSTNTYTGLNVIETNVNPPKLSNGGVNPSTGFHYYTPFTFSVNYSDADNNAPTFVTVTINSTVYSLTQQDPSDNNYMDGAIYTFSTILNVGHYNFYFNCSDGSFAVSLMDYIGPTVDFLMHWSQLRLDGIRIGTVITHGESNPRTKYPDLVYELIQRGANITDLTFVINSSILSNYDIIWFDESGSSMLTSEIDAIEQWVKNGGAFIITGDSMGSAINLVQRFNISYTSSGGNGYTTTIYPHPITTGVNEIYFPSPVSTLDISSQPNATLCIESNGFEMAVAMESGAGKLVIIVDKDVLYRYGQADNHLLFNNTFGWLGYAPNHYEPSLTETQVNPSTGNQSTQFNFTVKYTDLDDNSPKFINLLINGTPFSMIKENSSDNTYADGCIYQYITFLLPGNYSYWIECDDGFHYNSTSSNNLLVNDTNLFYPKLLNPQVSPYIGGNSTSFNFSVIYSDADNNLPSFVNITINTTTYRMLPFNPLDDNVMDGTLYYFITTLDFGFYQFQISCSDALYSNSTEWVDVPEVSPFHESYTGYKAVMINEICANPDFIELYNYGPDQDMTGWTIQIYDNNTIDKIYTFPNGWLFHAQDVVVLHEYSGTDTDTNLYTGWNIRWADRPIAVGLFDNTGAHIDWVQTSTHTATRPSDVEWIQDVSLIIINDYAYRASDSDTDKASDWAVAANGSQGTLNPGQVGQGISPYVTLLAPSAGSSLFTGMIDFNWSNPDVFVGPLNYTLQISNMSDFSNIFYQFDDILETPNTTSTTRFVDQPTARYYWRVRPVYGPFYGNWTNYTYFDLIQNNFAPNFTGVSVFPSGGDQFTQFNFSITYLDSDDDPPAFINLRINGTPNPMVPKDPLDTNYTDGCLFQYIMNFTPGTYIYSFECSDVKYNTSMGVFQLIVNKTNNFVPLLVNPINSPTIGQNHTTYYFYVWYYDADNNAPTYLNITLNNLTYNMIQVNPLDTNYMDGAQFFLSTLLDYGIYQYRIDCSDGGFINSTAWLSGPEVTPFHGLPTPPTTIGSVINSHQIVFTWETLNLSFGPVYYTLQISDSPDFSNIIYEVRNIAENPINTSVTISFSYPSGTYYWRVCPTYGPSNGTWSNYSIFDYVSPPKSLIWPWIVIIGLSVVAGSIIITRRRRRNLSSSTGTLISEEPETTSASLHKNGRKIPPYLEIDPELFKCPTCKAEYHIHKLNVLHQYQCFICEVPLERILRCPNCSKMIPFNQEDFFKYLKQDFECPLCTNQPGEKSLPIETESTERDVDNELKQSLTNLISNLEEVRMVSAEQMTKLLNKNSIPSFIGILLYEQESNLRALAAIALGMIGEKVALPILKHLLNEEKDALVQKYFLQSIAWLEKND